MGPNGAKQGYTYLNFGSMEQNRAKQDLQMDICKIVGGIVYCLKNCWWLLILNLKVTAQLIPYKKCYQLSKSEIEFDVTEKMYTRWWVVDWWVGAWVGVLHIHATSWLNLKERTFKNSNQVELEVGPEHSNYDKYKLQCTESTQ